MELKGKRLLIIGGNNVLDEIVSFAKENEVVLLSAGNVKTANIHKISQEQYYVDVTDSAVMKKLIAEKNIDGVFSCSSEAVIPHSIEYLSEMNMHCYATIEQWNVLMNKRKLKDACKKYGIDVIEEYSVNSLENVQYPVVVKPADNGGSAGITVCHNKAELMGAVDLAYSKSKCGEILIEKYIDAPYYQLEVYIQDGRAYLGYTKERIFYPELEGSPKQPFIDIYPADINERIYNGLFPKFSKLLLDLGIKNASVQLQGLYDDEHVYVMDIAYRLSGGMDYRAVQQEKGINIVKNHLEYALDGKWNGDFKRCEEPYKKTYVTICPGLKNGYIKQICGIEKIKNLPFVYDVFMYYNEGDTMTASGRFQQTFCRIFVEGRDKEQALSYVNEILSILEVKDEKGCSLMLENLL